MNQNILNKIQKFSKAQEPRKVELALSDVIIDHWKMASKNQEKLKGLIKEFENMRPYIHAAATDMKRSAEYGVEAFEEFEAAAKELGTGVPSQLNKMGMILKVFVQDAEEARNKYKL